MNLKELNSFKLSDAVTFHDKLNPKLWNGTKLRPDVREQLMLIAQDFLEELGVHDLDVKDITISGSNAAYSYTKHSDLDLHILVDMGNLPVDEVYKELFTAKKTIYNDTHDIKIHTIPVELYVQDSRQPVVSLGEYSVLNDQWIKIPTKRRSDFDQTATKSKYEKLLGLIEIALKSRKYIKVKHIIDTIKRYRQAGLDKGGEFGPENLAYKMLRSQGYITKLYDLRDKLHSEKLSFETMYQNIDEESNHWYDAGLKDAQRDAKLYPDRVVKKLNPRTRLKTMQDKRARHPEEVEQYSLGYRSLKQGVAENKADGINKMFNNLGDPVFANLQRVALLAMQGRQSEAAGRLQTVIKGADPAVQKKIIDAVNNIKPVTINGRVADSSTLDKSKQHNDWIINTFIPWVQSLLGQQGVAEEYNTMQFAAEKTPAINPYGGRKDNQFRGGISEAADKKISFKIQKGNGKFSTTLTVNNSPAGIYQYDSNTGRSIAEVYPEFKGKGLGKLLVLHAIYTAAQLGLDFQEDESRTSAYDNVLDSLSSNGYIVDDDGYWYVTGEGEQYLKRSLNEASGYIPSEKQKNDPRFKTALTVDVHPDSIKKNAKAFYWNTSRAGIPPTAKANGKI